MTTVEDGFRPVKCWNPNHDDRGRFTNANRGVANLTALHGGSTTRGVRSITSGKVVSPYPHLSAQYHGLNRPAQAAAIAKFRRQHGDLLDKPDHALGTWLDAETGTLWIDVVVTVKTHAEARRIARSANQIAYWDADKGREVRTGGTGLAKELTGDWEDWDGAAVEREVRRRLHERGDRGGHPRRPGGGWVDAGAGDRLRGAYDAVLKFDPNQPRDAHGRWTSGGGGRAWNEGPTYNGIAWRPVVSRQEAEEWSRGSTITDTATFVGRPGSIEQIMGYGFHDATRPGAKYSAGRVWGDGVYGGIHDFEVTTHPTSPFDDPRESNRIASEWVAAGGPDLLRNPSTHQYGDIKQSYTRTAPDNPLMERTPPGVIRFKVHTAKTWEIDASWEADPIAPPPPKDLADSLKHTSLEVEWYGYLAHHGTEGVKSTVATRFLLSKGYDSVRVRTSRGFYDGGAGGDQIVVFDPKNIVIIDPTDDPALRLFKAYEDVVKYNPNHDQLGRFSSSTGSASTVTYVAGPRGNTHGGSVGNDAYAVQQYLDTTYHHVIVGELYQIEQFAPSDTLAPHTAIRVAHVIDTLARRFPQVETQQVDCHETETMNSLSRYAEQGSGLITCNPLYFGSSVGLNTLHRNVGGDIASNFHPASLKGVDPIVAVITHEYGHAVSAHIKTGRKRILDEVLARRDSTDMLVHAGARAAVSGYAEKNDEECFAELFSEAYAAPHPRPVAKAFRKRLEALLPPSSTSWDPESLFARVET